MTTLDTQREAVTKAAKTVTDATVSAGTKAKDFSTITAKTVNDSTLVVGVKEFGLAASDTAKNVLEAVAAAAGKALEMVGDLPVGGKNVGERAQSTVDTVQDKIDVEQIQDQVAKLRHQIDGVVESWQESFRPTTVKNAAPKANTATTKATTTATKAAPKAKTATTKATTTAKKAAPKAKTATTKATTTAKKAAASKK